MRLCTHCGSDSPKKSIGEFYFCNDQCIEDRVDWQASEIARLTTALKSLTFNCRQYSGFIGKFEREYEETHPGMFTGLGSRFDTIITTAEAAIRPSGE